MAKKDIVIPIDDVWLEPEKLQLPGGGKIDDALDAIEAGPIDIDFEVIIPKECIQDADADALAKLNIWKIREIRDLESNLEAKAAETFAEILRFKAEDAKGDVDAYEGAKKSLDALNSYVERCVDRLRPIVRAAIAKTMSGKVKPDDLQTAGRVEFEKYELRPGVFANELDVDSPMLDLDKALKRKKWQQFGTAWKGGECVVSVKPKKDFKEAELKELKEALPEGFRQGAKAASGQFKADSATKVLFEFPAGSKMPKESLLRYAMKKQTGQAVFVERIQTPKTIKDDPAKGDANQSAKGTTSTKTGGKGSPPPNKGNAKGGNDQGGNTKGGAQPKGTGSTTKGNTAKGGGTPPSTAKGSSKPSPKK